jgi:SAM-dependent methyltransferase
MVADGLRFDENWQEHPELVSFFSTHRRDPKDLYPSERKFLPWLARASRTVLDVGCAAGGFESIWQAYNPRLRYVGVDTSSSLIGAARKLHPGSTFLLGDAAKGIGLPDRHSDVVQALGWLHWERNFEAALEELWRLTDARLFFDVRLQPGKAATIAFQKMSYADSWDGKTVTPWIVVGWTALARHIQRLGPSRLFGYGYLHRPSETVLGIDRNVCMATFVLEKRPRGAPKGRPQVILDLPMG